MPLIACDPFFVWAIFEPSSGLVPYHIGQAKRLNAILAAPRADCPSKWHHVLDGDLDEECLLTRQTHDITERVVRYEAGVGC